MMKIKIFTVIFIISGLSLLFGQKFEFNDKKDYEQYLKLILAAGYKETEKGKIITKELYTDYYRNREHIRLILPKSGENAPYTIIVFK